MSCSQRPLPNSSSHILLASPSSCSCMAVLCWIRFSLSMCLRNMALVIQRYGHTTRKQRCIPVFGYASHSHLGLGQSIGITVGQKDGPQPKGQGRERIGSCERGARGRNQTTRCQSSSQQHTNPDIVGARLGKAGPCLKGEKSTALERVASAQSLGGVPTSALGVTLWNPLDSLFLSISFVSFVWFVSFDF